MTKLNVRPLRDDLSFGARLSGITEAMLADEDIRNQINQLFEDRGLIVFEDVEPTQEMHVALSNVFGEMKEHPVATVERVDEVLLPGVIEMKHDPAELTMGLVEIEGKQLTHWLPWHFDHCYNNELNRAGVLRSLVIPPEGGQTIFIDGVDLYNSISPELRAKVEGLNIIYTLDLSFINMRFGLPETFRELKRKKGEEEVCELAKGMSRAIHPAVWTRASGEKVLHVSPWMAVGIEGHEDPEGDALLEELCQEIYKVGTPYYHQWKPTDMVIWDNWRQLHAVSGHNPNEPRCMHRTTIKGDYGLGYFEEQGKGGKLLEMTV